MEDQFLRAFLNTEGGLLWAELGSGAAQKFTNTAGGHHAQPGRILLLLTVI